MVKLIGSLSMLLVVLAATASGQTIEVEVDPTAYILDGYSIHVAYATGVRSRHAIHLSHGHCCVH